MTEVNDFTRLIFHCPSCRAKCQFQMTWNSAKGAVLTQIHGHVMRYVLTCSACGEHIFLQTRQVDAPHPTESTIEHEFPPFGLRPHPSIPAVVAVDLREASLCLSIGAWNACAAMCRRALQSCAKEKGANPKDDLFEQVQELKGKKIIPDLVFQMAHTIRKKGNIGAHPGRNPVVNDAVSAKEANAVFSIVEFVFKYVYELPAEVASLTGP